MEFLLESIFYVFSFLFALALIVKVFSEIAEAFDENADVRHIALIPPEYMHIDPISASKPKGYDKKINIPNKYYPLLVAESLRKKRHEWLVVGFSRNGSVFNSYAHKGNDNLSVHRAPTSAVISVALNTGADLIIIIHNHPGGSLQASEQDLKSANIVGRELNSNGLSLVEYVCVNGKFCKYHSSLPHKATQRAA